MAICNDSICPNCGGTLRYYDSVYRVVRTKRGVKNRVKIRRLKCHRCDEIHREIPDFIFPHKHYEAEIIKGVLEGFITPATIGFEDYPCEMTMNRWKADKKRMADSEVELSEEFIFAI